MTQKDFLSIKPEIAEAIEAGKPVVALESTILSHGMPFPQNVEFAHKVESLRLDLHLRSLTLCAKLKE